MKRELAALAAVVVVIYGAVSGYRYYADNLSDAAVALRAASKEKEPVKALTIIYKAMEEHCPEGRGWHCNVPDELDRAAGIYRDQALKRGDPKLLRELFARDNQELDKKKTYLAYVLEKAKASSDQDLLVAAASIYGDDRLRIIDTGQEVQYLERAWKAGDMPSAGRLAQIYQRQRNYDRAYLWSLRCIDDCVRDHYGREIQLLSLETYLEPDRIGELQANAKAGQSQ